jgi:hypothetical protein
LISLENTYFDLNNWFEKSKEGQVLFAYQGEITSEVITQLIEKTENAFDSNSNFDSMRKVTFHVVVECLQNLFHHGLAIEDGKPKYGAYLLLHSENSLKVITGNFIPIEHIQMLTDRINQINSMSKDELKALYKLILNNDEFSEKGGGGLGMIDIARKTGTKMEYEFFQVDEKVLFYVLKINII